MFVGRSRIERGKSERKDLTFRHTASSEMPNLFRLDLSTLSDDNLLWSNVTDRMIANGILPIIPSSAFSTNRLHRRRSPCCSCTASTNSTSVITAMRAAISRRSLELDFCCAATRIAPVSTLCPSERCRRGTQAFPASRYQSAVEISVVMVNGP